MHWIVFDDTSRRFFCSHRPSNRKKSSLTSLPPPPSSSSTQNGPPVWKPAWETSLPPPKCARSPRLTSPPTPMVTIPSSWLTPMPPAARIRHAASGTTGWWWTSPEVTSKRGRLWLSTWGRRRQRVRGCTVTCFWFISSRLDWRSMSGLFRIGMGIGGIFRLKSLLINTNWGNLRLAIFIKRSTMIRCQWRRANFNEMKKLLNQTQYYWFLCKWKIKCGFCDYCCFVTIQLNKRV